MQWDYVPDAPDKAPFVLLVEGAQGSGKTHLAYTFPQPIFHIDTENRGDKVGAKFKAGGAQVYWKVVKNFHDIRRTMDELIFPHFQAGTIIIDSGSELQTWAEAEWLLQSKKEKVYPLVLWSQVFAKVDRIVGAMRDRGFYVVITARLKPEYQGEQKTGALVMEGYKRLPYLADIHLRLENGQAAVLKNGFRGSAIERVTPLAEPSYSNIVEELIRAHGEHGSEWAERPQSAPPAELPKAPTPQPATQPTAQAVPAARSTPRPAAPQPSGNPGELVLPFGKYQGQTLADVWGKDAGYVKWLATNSTNAEVKAAAQTIAQAQPKATLPPETAANYAQTLVTEAQLKRLYAIANEHQVPAALVKEYMRDTHKVESSKALNRAQYEDVCAWLESQGKAAAQLEDIDIGDGIPDDNWAAGLEPPPEEETFGDAHGQFAFGGDAA
jgi:hypothetical protein